MRRRSMLIVVLSIVLASLGPSLAAAESPVLLASATLVDSAGDVVGFAKLLEQEDGSVLVSIHASGLSAGAHGVHVHGIGSCVAPAFTSAGSHFNPTGAAHGSHSGDLGNITANPAGQANLTLITEEFTLAAGSLSLMDTDGSALVIHASPDDLVTNPTGNSGARVACGVIQSE